MEELIFGATWLDLVLIGIGGLLVLAAFLIWFSLTRLNKRTAKANELLTVIADELAPDRISAPIPEQEKSPCPKCGKLVVMPEHGDFHCEHCGVELELGDE